MTPEEKALRDAFLAELWPTCREVPRADRGIPTPHPQAVDNSPPHPYPASREVS